MFSADERAELDANLACVVDSARLLSLRKLTPRRWDRVDVAVELAKAKSDALRRIQVILDRHTDWVLPS